MRNFASVLAELHAKTIHTSPLGTKGEDMRRNLMLQYSRTSRTSEVKDQTLPRPYEGFVKSNGKLKKLVTRSTIQFVLAFRIRNLIRGQLTPQVVGYGGLLRNHLFQQPGGDHLPGGLPHTGKSIERELV